MAQTYKTWEVMKMLTENPKLQFKNTKTNLTFENKNNSLHCVESTRYPIT